MNKQSFIAGLISLAYVFILPTFIALGGIALIGTVFAPDSGWGMGGLILIPVFFILLLVTTVAGLILTRKPLKKRGVSNPVIVQIVSWLTSGFATSTIITPLLGLLSIDLESPEAELSTLLHFIALSITVSIVTYVGFFLLFTKVLRPAKT